MLMTARTIVPVDGSDRRFGLIRWGTAAAVAAVLLAGAGYAAWVAHSHAQAERHDRLQRAAVIARSLDRDVITAIMSREQDSTSAEVSRLREYLNILDQTFPEVQVVYLLGRRPDGSILFFSGSADADLSVHAAQCERHSQAVAAFTKAVRRGEECLTGPFSGPNGPWVSALTPIPDRASGRTVALLGMDMTHQGWRQQRWRPLLRIVLVTLLLAASAALGGWSYHRRQAKPELQTLPLVEPWCVAFFGLLLAAAAGWQVHQSEQQQQKTMFRQLADSRTETIAEVFSDLQMAELEAMAGYLETIENLTRDKIVRYCQTTAAGGRSPNAKSIIPSFIFIRKPAMKLSWALTTAVNRGGGRRWRRRRRPVCRRRPLRFNWCMIRPAGAASSSATRFTPCQSRADCGVLHRPCSASTGCSPLTAEGTTWHPWNCLSCLLGLRRRSCLPWARRPTAMTTCAGAGRSANTARCSC